MIFLIIRTLWLTQLSKRWLSTWRSKDSNNLGCLAFNISITLFWIFCTMLFSCRIFVFLLNSSKHEFVILTTKFTFELGWTKNPWFTDSISLHVDLIATLARKSWQLKQVSFFTSFFWTNPLMYVSTFLVYSEVLSTADR